ncbi:hypothetical protein RAS1_42990 [Phycisphaerae bacterium RAS1]|nr:hypothetical protein RAS1_42990 [Phycisphaerae bacterium RAS1]
MDAIPSAPRHRPFRTCGGYAGECVLNAEYSESMPRMPRAAPKLLGPIDFPNALRNITGHGA